MTGDSPTASRAPARLSPEVRAYIDGGGITGAAVRRNERAWGERMLVPRVLRNVTSVDTAVTLLGHRWAAPIAVAPSGGQSFLDPGGERATARAAAATGIGFVLSSSSSVSVAEIGAVGGFLQQLYLPRSRESILPLVDAALAAGAWGLVLTVDAPPVADRLAFRAGVATSIASSSVNIPRGVVNSSAPDLSPDDVAWLSSRSGVPVLVKGVLHPDDAALSIDAGAVAVTRRLWHRLDEGCPTRRRARLRRSCPASPRPLSSGLREGLVWAQPWSHQS